MTTSQIISRKWIRVTKRYPCPICQKPDWCMVSEDGKSAICARIESEKRAGNKGAGWIHDLDNYQQLRIPQPRPFKQNPKAAIQVLDTAYRNLLSILTLSPSHKANLISRGIPESELSRYGTMPERDRGDIVRYLQSHNIQLSGVPGFFTDIGGSWDLGGAPGICIPVMDLKGRIAGIQIRREGNVTAKYVWLSSKDKLNGCGSGAPIHIARWGNPESQAVWITEGPLKADIISLRLKRIVLAVPGVSNWAGAIPIIWKLKPKAIVVAFDMDKLTNPAVKTHKGTLIHRLQDMRLQILEANWNPKYKGLDDLLSIGEVEW